MNTISNIRTARTRTGPFVCSGDQAKSVLLSLMGIIFNQAVGEPGIVLGTGVWPLSPLEHGQQGECLWAQPQGRRAEQGQLQYWAFGLLNVFIPSEATPGGAGGGCSAGTRMLELLSLPQPLFGGDYWNTSKALASSQQPDVPLGKLYSGVRRRSRQHRPPGCQPERCGDTSSLPGRQPCRVQAHGACIFHGFSADNVPRGPRQRSSALKNAFNIPEPAARRVLGLWDPFSPRRRVTRSNSGEQRVLRRKEMTSLQLPK